MVSCSSTVESLVKQTDVSRCHCMLSLLHFTSETLIPNIRYQCCMALYCLLIRHPFFRGKFCQILRHSLWRSQITVTLLFQLRSGRYCILHGVRSFPLWRRQVLKAELVYGFQGQKCSSGRAPIGSGAKPDITDTICTLQLRHCWINQLLVGFRCLMAAAP